VRLLSVRNTLNALALGPGIVIAEQSAMSPAGIQAERIGELWWLYLGIAIIVYVPVLALLLIPLFRSSTKLHTTSAGPLIVDDPAREKRLMYAVTAAVGLTVAFLLIMLIGEFHTERTLQKLAGDPDALKMTVTGKQWWWDVCYDDPVPSKIVRTANEIHIPVGRTIEIELRSSDVIHSFWVPNLHGKKDMIPGYPTTTHLRADRPGTYEGQCAEFCGYQHAHMRLIVIAEPPEKFEQWLQQQRASAVEPAASSQERGREVFLGNSCVMCHTIQGTGASATIGPDLTHLGSRQKIGGASFPNNRGHLAGWILNPQQLKPGAQMPTQNLSPEQLQSLLDYLESLK
jgi:cytochrome c oxidase subunit II